MWTSKNAQNTEAVGIEHSLPQKRVNIQKNKTKPNYKNDMYKYTMSFYNVL